jgi:glycosyltransferase involved in cell wall biosynthesis
MAPSFGVVCIEHHGLAPLLPARRHNRWALTMHNVPSQVAVHAAAVAPARRQRWLREQERKRAERLERWALDAFDVVFAVSEEDAAALPGPAIVVPNGVDTERFRPSALPREPRLVFIGTLGYLPNVDGITWFCEEVMPRVQSVVPGAVLDVVGRLPTPEVLALGQRPGIKVHVDVPDVLPLLHGARLAVVPLRIGSGTRLKALEAMAAGRPVVGTSTGLEGLGVVSGQHALVTDGVEEMAGAVLAVLAGDELARRLALEGRRLVESRYRWDRIGERFVAALLGLPS